MKWSLSANQDLIPTKKKKKKKYAYITYKRVIWDINLLKTLYSM